MAKSPSYLLNITSSARFAREDVSQHTDLSNKWGFVSFKSTCLQSAQTTLLSQASSQSPQPPWVTPHHPCFRLLAWKDRGVFLTLWIRAQNLRDVLCFHTNSSYHPSSLQANLAASTFLKSSFIGSLLLYGLIDHTSTGQIQQELIFWICYSYIQTTNSGQGSRTMNYYELWIM